MTAKQENKLTMYLAVQSVCDRNTSSWQTLPAFADAYTEFGQHVTNIQSLAQSQAVDATGLAADKEQLRKAMAQAAVEIASAANAYAKKVKNNDLVAKTNVTLSSITTGRDTIAADTARNLHAVATASLANLGPYGVTAAKLTALKAKIDAYSASITKPRDAVASSSTATKQLSNAFDAADTALTDQMDSLMPQFAAANAKFMADYNNARIIVNSGVSSSSSAKAKASAKKPTPPAA